MAVAVAHRTSPTNVGMSLLSALAAHDLGYLTTAALLERLDHTLTTLEGLERFRGHFLNWYDTTTLAPLHPRYVSSVDSGNLAAALIALAQGLRQLTAQPQTPAQLIAGLRDNASLLTIARVESEARMVSAAAVSRLARAIAAETRREFAGDVIAAAPRLRRRALERSRGVQAWRSASMPAGDVLFWREAVLQTYRCARRATADPTWPLRCARAPGRGARRRDALRLPVRPAAAHLRDRLPARRCGRARDASTARFYDLLASEARLASFVAIAKGDVPQHHWFHLGRLVTNVHGRATLVSWGGTMFEYLMPLLLMRDFPGTLLDQSCRVERASPDRVRQTTRRAVGHLGIGVRLHRSRRQLSIPCLWRARPRPEARAGGRSGGRALRDRAGRLVDPAAAAENFARLAADGLDGRFGFYEALDYRPRTRDVDAGARQRHHPGHRPRVLRASSGHVARRARKRDLRRCVCHPLSCRSTGAGE